MQKAQSPVRDITRLNSKINDDSGKGKCPRRFLSLAGQSLLEYAVVIAVVVAAIIAMGVYVQHSIQAHFKTLENRVNASVNKAHTAGEIQQPPEEPPEETSGPGDGTKADPYKLNTLTPGGGSYIVSGRDSAFTSLSGNSSVYYKIDLYGYTGRSYNLFTMWVAGFDNSEYLDFYYSVVDKTTGNTLTTETKISQNRSLQYTQKEGGRTGVGWDLDDVIYIFRIDNTGSGSAFMNVAFTANCVGDASYDSN